MALFLIDSDSDQSDPSVCKHTQYNQWEHGDVVTDSHSNQSNLSVGKSGSASKKFRKSFSMKLFRLWQGNETHIKWVFLAGRNMSKTSSERSVTDGDNRSIHSDSIEEVHNVPLQVIIRPFPPELDEQKVHSLMDTIKVSDCVSS